MKIHLPADLIAEYEVPVIELVLRTLSVDYLDRSQ